MQTIEDSQLGPLHFNRELNWYAGIHCCRGEPLEICLALDAGSPLDPLLARARALLPELDRLGVNAKGYASSHLLALKNSSWLEQGEKPVSREQFESRLRLSTVVLYPHGPVELFYGDGDLFWGHCVLVTLDATNQFVEADISS